MRPYLADFLTPPSEKTKPEASAIRYSLGHARGPNPPPAIQNGESPTDSPDEAKLQSLHASFASNQWFDY